MSYTPKIVVGTWVGARSTDIHFNGGLGSGSSLALPISGSIWQQIERDEKLKQQYLSPFHTDSMMMEISLCPAYHQKGLKGFINRLSKNDDKALLKKKKAEKQQAMKKERKARRKRKREAKEKSGIWKFFDKVFGGGKDEK